jgi:hypothetical protein
MAEGQAHNTARGPTWISLLYEDIHFAWACLCETWVQLIFTALSVLAPFLAVVFFSCSYAQKVVPCYEPTRHIVEFGNITQGVTLNPTTNWVWELGSVFVMLTPLAQLFSYYINVSQPFKPRSRPLALLSLLVTYASVIVSPAAMYFLLCFQFDLYDACARWNYYSDQFLSLGQVTEVWPYGDDLRAFRGVKPRLFSSIDWHPSTTDPGYFWRPTTEAPSLVVNDLSVSSREELTDWARTGMNRSEVVVKFQPKMQWPIFWQCLYFSIMTTTTLGGDIVPWCRPARLLACLQVIFGVVLFVLALSLLLADVEKPNELLRPARTVAFLVLSVWFFAIFMTSPGTSWLEQAMSVVSYVVLLVAFVGRRRPTT